MRRVLFLTLAPAVLLACKARAPEGPTGLQLAVASARSLPPCDAAIPMEWPASWPVPAKDGARYKVFFYPLRDEEGISVYAPAGEALLDAAGASPLACGLTGSSPKVLSKTRWPAGLSEVGIKDFETMAAGLYDKTEAAAGLYRNGRPLSAPEKTAAEEYLKAFESMAEPALLPYYYRLNPDFWEWLRRAAGRSISAPPPQ